MGKPNAHLKRIKDLAAKNLEEGEAFLSQNKNREGVVSLNNDLQYEIIVLGNGEIPSSKSKVLCHYQGQLLNGFIFDSSYQRKRPEALLIKELIRGWQQALLLMPLGSKWKLYIHPRLAYGFESITKESGGNCTLIFDIELIAIL
ncbi:FKBP-type peptidyl-prolyl cis-trans isomerase FklB [Sphingobacterium nematocida]|uniref:Peptidyl-prolyl cis-trans isomerase n=1 Tax=Sphingobacterium nematocida TaxID=1513896 RepID=A0A1T5E0T2_9SPHI|nr:FKBP-type peptidyl-prolyl cis-trans isomerase [Sphingobacterium nematocida]SKB77469.1 FKBP-type peptidyl-prolyl cis-trans isomerase FklB [Sphingobacterium nematocida]